jgi:hypothetical protein
MPAKTVTVKSFADLARAIQREDVRKAENLRKSAPLARNRPANSGPRVAR